MDWYEAVAFTRWLLKQLNYAISLPIEQQWEKAARGEDGRLYPWGDQYQSGFANTNDKAAGEQNLEESTSVGVFLQGASPYGVFDMAGNVWEWCLNKYDSPNNIEIDTSDDRRVLCGGSWADDPERARCAYHLRYYPDSRYGSFGFRVVCLSPLTDH